MFGIPAYELAWLAAALLAAGAVTGVLAGVFGVGGGAVIVPVLYEIFRVLGVPDEVRMQLCVGTSLAIIVPTTIRSYLAHRARGAVIDDVVTDVDNLAERLRRHRETGSSAPVWTTIVEAVTAVRRPLLYAVLIVAAATLPLFFLRGEGGEFLPEIALSYLLEVAASIVVALTLTPVLAMMLLARGSGRAQSPAAAWLQQRYDRSGSRAVGRAKPRRSGG